MTAGVWSVAMRLFATLLLTLSLKPQTPTVRTAPLFRVAETLHLEIRKSREDSRNPSTGFSITPVDVVVKEVAGDGFILDWIYGKARTQQEREPSNPTIKLDTDYTNWRLSIVLKSDGGFYLQNAADVFDTIRARTDEMIERGLLPFPEAQKKQVGERVRLIVTPESQRAYIMRDVRLFLGSFGLELQPGTTFEKTAPVLNPVGSGTMESLMRAELKSVDANDAVIVVEQQYPSEVAAKIANESRPPIVVPNPSDLSSANVVDRTELSYAFQAGVFREIRHEFGITIGSFRRVDQIEMSVVSTH